MPESTLSAALRQFDTAEANLLKAEKNLDRVMSSIPSGICFGSNNEYEDACHNFQQLYAALPRIDGVKHNVELMDLDQIAQNRLDATELGEIEVTISVERSIEEPQRILRDYRRRFDEARRKLVRTALAEQMDKIDELLIAMTPLLHPDPESARSISDDRFATLKEAVSQINNMLGSSIPKPPRWSDLHRHLHFGMIGDLRDIIHFDWPAARTGLRTSMYGENDPIPMECDDLGVLLQQKPSGPVITRLKWDSLSDEDFERLIFGLMTFSENYENPEWLMQTRAADRGRDLSVTRVLVDVLSGTRRERVIVQCKHWRSRSVALSDLALVKEQMQLWEPPRIDALIVATSGRFTADAVQWIERHNQSDSALKIQMWAESHLEMLLASRPNLIAEFRLR